MTRHSTLGTRRFRPGFTFVEILATMAFLGIVLPAVMAGVTMSLSAANSAKRQALASSLAHGKLMELASQTQLQQVPLAGDFAPDQPEYRWSAQLSNWVGQTATAQTAGLLQLDVTVWWQGSQGHERSLTLSTLVNTATQQSTTGTTPSGTGATP